MKCIAVQEGLMPYLVATRKILCSFPLAYYNKFYIPFLLEGLGNSSSISIFSDGPDTGRMTPLTGSLWVLNTHLVCIPPHYN